MVPLVAVESDLMFTDNYFMLGCGDESEGGVSVEDHNSCSLLLLFITIMAYIYSHTQHCNAKIRCVVNVQSHFKSLQCT